MPTISLAYVFVKLRFGHGSVGNLVESKEDFDNAVLESIDETIHGLLGQEVLKAVYSNLENKRLVKRAEIPHQIPALSVMLEWVFGSSTPRIVRLIARRLYSKLGLQFPDKEGYTLLDYVRDAKYRQSRKHV
jgi:hypothetical protein